MSLEIKKWLDDSLDSRKTSFLVENLNFLEQVVGSKDIIMRFT